MTDRQKFVRKLNIVIEQMKECSEPSLVQEMLEDIKATGEKRGLKVYCDVDYKWDMPLNPLSGTETIIVSGTIVTFTVPGWDKGFRNTTGYVTIAYGKQDIEILSRSNGFEPV